MKAKILLPVITGVIVLALLVGLGAMALIDVEVPHLEQIEQMEAVAGGITNIVRSAETNLARAGRMGDFVDRMKTEPADFGVDPFKPPKPPEPEPDQERVSAPVPPPPDPDPSEVSPPPDDEDSEPMFSSAEMDLYRVRDITEWPDLKLTGTIVSGDRSLAIINGEVYRIGGIVEGLQISHVGRDAVELVSPIPGEKMLIRLE